MNFSAQDLQSKHIFIISHFRSGSSWFTRCFKNHFIVGEILHPWLTIRKVQKNYLAYNRPDFSAKVTDYENRFKIINAISKNHKIVTKIHSTCLSEPSILNFLRKKASDINNNQFILIERKNKFNVFLSHLFALQINSWNNYQDQKLENISYENLEISISVIEETLKELQDFEDRRSMIMDSFSPLYYFYEDLLLEKENSFWSPNQSNLKIQNNRSKYRIANLQYILNVVERSSYQHKQFLAQQLMVMLDNKSAL